MGGKKQNNNKVIMVAVILLLLFVFIVGVWAIFYNALAELSDGTIAQEAQLGDAMASIGVLFAGLAFVAFMAALFWQMYELRVTRETLKIDLKIGVLTKLMETSLTSYEKFMKIFSEQNTENSDKEMRDRAAEAAYKSHEAYTTYKDELNKIVKYLELPEVDLSLKPLSEKVVNTVNIARVEHKESIKQKPS